MGQEIQSCPGVQPGIYRHFKGGLYRVLGVGAHTETKENLVIYQDDSLRLWIRPVAVFTETLPSGQSRFRLLRALTTAQIQPSRLLDEIDQAAASEPS